MPPRSQVIMNNHDHLPFKVGQLAEAKSFLQGFRGAWFRCKIKEISLRKGHIGHVLEYIDFPDEKLNWTKLYQKPPISKSRLKEKNRLLMIDLLPPPDGEGLSYEVFCKDLRPSLDWSPSYGWSVSIPKESETGRCCARLVKPVYYVSIENEGRTDSQGMAGSSLKCNPSFSCQSSDCLSSPLDGSEHSPEKEMTEQPLNIADSKKRNLILETRMDLQKGYMGIGATSSSASVLSSYNGDTSEEMIIGGRDQCGSSGPSKKRGIDGIIGFNSMHSDTLEAAILDLEELVNKIKWIKGILEPGIPLPNTLQPPWRFWENYAPSTPK